MSAHLSDQTMTDVLEKGGSPVEWAHVASCPACQQRSQLLTALAQDLGAVEALAIPAEREADILAAAEAAALRGRPVPRLRRWLVPAVAAAAVFIAVLGPGMLERARPPIAPRTTTAARRHRRAGT